MGFQIEDGKGSGRKVEIDELNRIRSHAETEPVDRHINHESGKVWSIPFEALNPTADDDYVFYLKNTGDNDIHITDFRVSVDTSATRLKINKVTGTAANGTTTTAVSRNTASTEVPSATIETGADITGLTSTGTIFYMNCPTVDTLYHLSTSSNIIIGKGGAIGLLVESATANVTGIISIVETSGDGF